jgi:hypothetical protein
MVVGIPKEGSSKDSSGMDGNDDSGEDGEDNSEGDSDDNSEDSSNKSMPDREDDLGSSVSDTTTPRRRVDKLHKIVSTLRRVNWTFEQIIEA